MKLEKIKPIPKKILAAIKRRDLKDYPAQNRHFRFYSYMAKNDKELVQVIVAVKNYNRQWYCKQVIVHGVHSKICFIKDIKFSSMGGYAIGWHDLGIQKEQKWFEDGQWDWQHDKYFNPYAPIINMEYIAEHFPEYKYSAVEQYLFLDTLPYLRIYEEYPQAEYFVKAGLHYLATCKSVLRKASKDKQFCKWIMAHRSEMHNIYAATVLEAYKTGRPIKETQEFLSRRKYFISSTNSKPIRELFKSNQALERFFSYIDKQQTNYYSYNDYLTACRYLGLDMTEEKNLLPHDFKRWHDIRIDEYHTKKALEDAEKKKKLVQDFRTVAEKYLPLQYQKQAGYIAIIAMSPSDLVKEGDALHHCVGRMNYDQKMIREDSLIFFIRAKETPDKPLVTVEYSPSKKKVLQCYGDGDTKPSDEILHFVNKQWLPFANRQIKRLAA